MPLWGIYPAAQFQEAHDDQKFSICMSKPLVAEITKR